MDNNKLLQLINEGNIDEFVKVIDEMAASKAYLFIRDNMNYKHVKVIQESSKENYQKFQDIKLRAKQSWDYDHKTATMEDVNRACMNVYTLVLRLMSAQNTDYREEFSKIQLAINKIEEKIGIEPTVWEEEPNNIDGGNENVNDVQGVQENI